MATQSPSTTMRLLALVGLRPLSYALILSDVAIVLAVGGPIVCAWIGESSGDWSWFERSGATTSAIGLLMGSRRYIEFPMADLVVLKTNGDLKPHLAELREGVQTTKRGLALSAFGTIIWGWGAYLGWVSFIGFLVWAFFAVRDVTSPEHEVTP